MANYRVLSEQELQAKGVEAPPHTAVIYMSGQLPSPDGREVSNFIELRVSDGNAEDYASKLVAILTSHDRRQEREVLRKVQRGASFRAPIDKSEF